MADVEHYAALGCVFGELIEILVLDDRAALFAVKAMGDNIALGQQPQHIIIERWWFPDMHHDGQIEHAAELFGELERDQIPAPRNHGARPNLEADDDVAVFLDHGNGAVDVDRAHVLQFGHAVAGDQTNRSQIEEGVDVFARRLDDEFAHAVEIGFAR